MNIYYMNEKEKGNTEAFIFVLSSSPNPVINVASNPAFATRRADNPSKQHGSIIGVGLSFLSPVPSISF